MRIKDQRAIEALDALDGSDPEEDHSKADAIILDLVHPEVKAAYVRLAGDDLGEQGRAPWWATA